MLGQLPIDVLYEILRSLSIQDIVRLQRVSNRFYEITQERIVWANAYHSTILPCPSGPYASQDATSLKRQLIHSTKLEKNWPRRRVASTPKLNIAGSTASRDAHARREDPATRVYSPTSIRRFTLPIPRPLALTAITGRWIVVVTGTGIWCIDLEAEEAQLGGTSEDYVVRPVELHKCVDTTLEFSFVVSAMDREGRMVLYVVAEERAHTGDEEG
ncbi:hypothetical protein PAXINDRAFT_99301 [Paxillus involutus ATCC 200175]|uniref:F-box domain-containing protein n=1 Tax=Paxillus involutus ATCC 200175 TaxID=664439 RepID=A0A0C9TJX5_PAXIN|nr:hypothetical protein PAXINDRAFT_99301 [Paxillus involutus ATCC 200175]